MKKFALAFAAATMAVTGLGTAVPAAADPPHWAPAHGKRYKERNRYRDRDRYRENYRYSRAYDDRGYYYEPRRITRNSYMWRGRDGRYYCKRDNGTTGLVIGAGVGALAGHELAGRGDRTLGAILGGAIGAVVGREIDRGSLRCR